MRASVIVPLLALALLAGCLGGGNNPSSGSHSSTSSSASHATPGEPLANPKPIPPVKVGSPGAAEPNIAVAPDGTLYVSNPGQVWRSTDGSKSWQGPVAVDGGGDGDTAVDGAGNLYYLGLFGANNTAIAFSASHDGGKTFSRSIDLSDPKLKSGGTGADREWIDADAAGRIFATWRGSVGGQAALEFRTSPDGGLTWNDKTRVGDDGDEGPVVHDPTSGELYIASIDQAGTVDPSAAGAVVHVYTSFDQGATWMAHTTNTLKRNSPVEPNGYASDFPVMAVDQAGNAYLVYSGPLPFPAPVPDVTPPEEANLFGIYLQASKDHGNTWGPARLVSASNKDARFPWVAAGAQGRAAIVWYENVLGNPGELVPDEWNTKLWESLDAPNASSMAVTVTLTPTPNHVGALCTSGTGCLAADRSLLDYFEVALDNSGQPVVAWASSVLGTAAGAVQGTDIDFGGAIGTPLK